MINGILFVFYTIFDNFSQFKKKRVGMIISKKTSPLSTQLRRFSIYKVYVKHFWTSIYTRKNSHISINHGLEKAIDLHVQNLKHVYDRDTRR